MDKVLHLLLACGPFERAVEKPLESEQSIRLLTLPP